MSCEKCLTQVQPVLQTTGVPARLSKTVFSRNDDYDFHGDQERSEIARSLINAWPNCSLSDDLLTRASSSGWSVAHKMAWVFRFTEFPRHIIRLADKRGWTVGHVMASRGYAGFLEDEMGIADHNGWTIAHTMAQHRANRNSFSAHTLQLHDQDGVSVADVIRKYVCLVCPNPNSCGCGGKGNKV